MKIVFDHSKENVLEAFGLPKEKSTFLSSIAYDKVLVPTKETMVKNLPAILESKHPMEDTEGFNAEMDKIMPSYSELAEKIQDAWIEAGEEITTIHGFLLSNTVDKITDSISHSMHSEIAICALKDLKDKTEAPTEEN